MRGNPELALIRSEEQHLARQEMLASSERRDVIDAIRRHAERFGYGDTAMLCAIQATDYTLLANPRSPNSPREESRAAAEREWTAKVAPTRPILRLPSADALFDAGAGG